MTDSGSARAISTAIQIDEIHKDFGQGDVLRGVSLDIAPGEFFTLLGASGCGKTTLLRCIAGFEKPSGGRVSFDGRDVTSLDPWNRDVGFVFQNYALWPHLTVFDNIAYGLRMRKTSKGEIADRVAKALDLIGLPLLEKRFPGQLSGGQQQRIAIARALVISPQVLLLDEPLSNLDAKLRIRMRRELREIQKSLGITSVYVTHDQEEALEISDRIAVMEDGSVRQVGRPEEIYERPLNRFTAGFVGRSNFLPGRVEAGGFRTRGGALIPLPPSRGEAPAPEGEAVLSFRPENVIVAAEEMGTFGAVVVNSAYLGNSVQCLARLADGTEILHDSTEMHSAETSLRLKITRCIFFGPEES